MEEMVVVAVAVAAMVVEEKDEMVMEEVVAMQDLKCEHYVGLGNMTRLTISSICVVSGLPL
jgi:hypothetical protein